MTEDIKAEINQLKRDVLSDDRKLARASADRMSEIGGDEVVDFLIALLDSDQKQIRNTAALALRDIKSDKALEPLLGAIFKKENFNNNGTLVYALETLDCSQKLVDIFKILLYQTYLSKISAYTILDEQEFEFSRQDILAVKQMWEDCIKHPDTCPCYEEEEVRASMQNAVDGYMGYLDVSPK